MSRLLAPALAFNLVFSVAAVSAQAPAPVRPAKAAERIAAITAIQAQLKAFGRGDYKAAIVYQSSGLRKNFTSPQQFQAMITQVYPEFAHSKRAVFGPAQANPTGSHLVIPAAVTGLDGITVHAVYLMVREGKSYKVEGVAGGATPAPSNPGSDVPSRDV